MTARPARTGVLPPATPISWEAEAPTSRLPVIVGVPAAAARGAVSARHTASLGRHAAGLVTGVLVVLVALVLMGALLQATGVLVR